MGLRQRHVVLGLVVERSGYGYQISQQARDRFAMGGTGVYQALDKLVEQRQVKLLGPRSGPDSPRAAPRTMYEATDEGRQALHDWIMGSSVFAWPRQELDVKLSFSTPLHWPRLIQQLRDQALYCLGEVRDLTKPPLVDHRDPSVTWPEADEILQRKAKVAALEGRIEWCHHAAEMLEGLLARTPKPV